MLTIISLTLQEAASTLGLSVGASAAEVNTAYRKLVAKYHPDANRSKSDAERKAAEAMFKKVNEAKKIMLKPELAEPEVPEPSSSATSGASGYAAGRSSSSTAAGRGQTSGSASARTRRDAQSWQGNSYQASASASKASPTGRNTATSFHCDVPKVADPAEDAIAQIYRNEARGEYRKFADKIRVTPSTIVTLAFMAYAAFSFIFGGGAAGSTIVMILVLVLKAIYDIFFSYYVHNLLVRKANLGWIAQCGIGTVLLAGAWLILGVNTPGASSDASSMALNVTNAVSGGRVASVGANSSTLMLVMGIAILVGIALVALGVWLGKRKGKKQ